MDRIFYFSTIWIALVTISDNVLARDPLQQIMS